MVRFMRVGQMVIDATQIIAIGARSEGGSKIWVRGVVDNWFVCSEPVDEVQRLWAEALGQVPRSTDPYRSEG